MSTTGILGTIWVSFVMATPVVAVIISKINDHYEEQGLVKPKLLSFLVQFDTEEWIAVCGVALVFVGLMFALIGQIIDN